MSVAATHGANRSDRDVLRNRRVAGLLLGDLLANVGTGMLIVAMPVQTLSIHGNVPKAIAIGLVEAAPFVLSTILALSIGLGRLRVPPRTLLITDCVLRPLTFATLGVLAVTDQLTLPVLIIGLLFGATFRMAGSSSRRLLATSMAGETGPVRRQRLARAQRHLRALHRGPGSGRRDRRHHKCRRRALLRCVRCTDPVGCRPDIRSREPSRIVTRSAVQQSRESGWRILRRRPVAARLLVRRVLLQLLLHADRGGASPLCPRDVGRRRVCLGPHVGRVGGRRIHRRCSGESAAEPSAAAVC